MPFNLEKFDQFFFKYPLDGHILIVNRTLNSQDPNTDAPLSSPQLRISIALYHALDPEMLRQNQNAKIHTLFSPIRLRYIKNDDKKSPFHYFDIVDLDGYSTMDDAAIEHVLNTIINISKRVLTTHHKEIMKVHRLIIPYFHACVEMDEALKQLSGDKYRRVQLQHQHFNNTMRDLINVYENHSNILLDDNMTSFELGDDENGYVRYEHKRPSELRNENSYQKLLTQLNNQSKQALGTENRIFISIGCAVLAASAITLGVAFLGIGVAIALAGSIIIFGAITGIIGAALYYDRAHASPIGTAMQTQLLLFKQSFQNAPTRESRIQKCHNRMFLGEW